MHKIKFTILLLCSIACINLFGNSIFEINHVTIFAQNLDKAVKNFEKAGFSIIETGNFGAGFVHNAHIPFTTGNYLEIFAPVNPKTWSQFRELKKTGKLKEVLKGQKNMLDKRFLKHLGTIEGLTDYALKFQDNKKINEVIAKMKKEGLLFHGPINMHRITPGGVTVKWVVYVPDSDALPFLIKWENYQTPPVNVAEQKKLKLSGIKNITIAVNDFKKSVDSYKILLGVEPKYLNIENMSYCKAAVFNLGNETITVVSPDNINSMLNGFLKNHGEGPFSLTIGTTDKNFKQLSPVKLDNSNIELIYNK